MIVAALIAMTMSLSGCFIVPLMDNRSPFDGVRPSRAEVNDSLPAIRTALDGLDSGEYVLTAVTGSDNCEGACLLSPAVMFDLPGGASSTATVPTALIATVLVAVLPVVAGDLPLRLQTSYGSGGLDGLAEIVHDSPSLTDSLSLYDSSVVYIHRADFAELQTLATRYLASAP